MKTKIFFISFILLFTSYVFAQDGSLDTSFDTDGKVITDFSQGNTTSSDAGNCVAIQSDGKIVVAGNYWAGTVRDFAVTRYNSDGSLDNTFGGDGKVTTDIINDVWGGGSDEAYDVAVQSDGKIVVVGTTSSGDGNDYFAVVRYNTDGSLDNTFSSDGMTITYFGGNIQQANGVKIQSDGKIVVAGYVEDYSDPDTLIINFAVARYNANGSLDNSFDSDGILTTDFNNGGQDFAQDVVVQSDGKIVVVGYTQNFTDGDIALVRYNTDGSLDTSFDTDGKLTTDFGVGYDYGYAVTVQTDGKILVSGQVADASLDNFGLARYNADGSLDTSFDTDGKVLTNFTSYSYGYDIAIQSDGKILVGGTTYNPSLSKDVFAVAKYNSDGSLDTSFDTDGKTTESFNSNDNTGKGIAVQSDGKIILTGKAYNGNKNDFAVLRYNNSVSSSISVDIKIFMEGPYNSTSMNASLTLPTTSPYTEDQETVTSIPVIQGNQVVDWVLVELRDKNNSSIVLESQSAFILQDGTIVDLDGTNPFNFTLPSDDYFIAVKHRNHLSVMSATAVTF